MAEKGKKELSPITGYEDGYALVSKLEGEKLGEMISTYMARIEAYKFDTEENYVQVTMKIVFPPGTSHGNANLWSFLIAGSAHASLYKPQVTVYPNQDGVAAYVQWRIWKGVKYLESKRQDSVGF